MIGKILFDDIYIWSRTNILSIKTKKLLNGDIGNISNIFKIIMNDIKNNNYGNKVLIINKKMKIHTYFMKMIQLIKFPKDYQVIQICSSLYKVMTKLNKLNNIGAMIINLVNTDIRKFTLDSSTGVPNKIYDSGIGYFIHPEEFNRLVKQGNHQLNSRYQNYKEQFFFINSSKLIFSKNTGPFWFIKQARVSKSLEILFLILLTESLNAL